MKHTTSITLYLVVLFLVSQIFGLFVINQYIDKPSTEISGNVTYSELPFSIERPEIEQKDYSWIYISIAVVVGTLLIFLLIKLRKPFIWRYWFLFAVIFCLLFAIYPFMPFSTTISALIAFSIALTLALFKVFKSNVWIHNITEVLMYGGLAAIFVPIMSIFSIFILLIIISLYDMFAVWQSKHMVKMAKFQTEAKLFAGLSIPYNIKSYDSKNMIQISKEEAEKIKLNPNSKKVVVEKKNAVLGGGDIGFPLIFSGTILADLIMKYSLFQSFFLTFIITIFTTIALFLLLYYAKKDRFYPAMPFISAGCFLGYGIVLLIINFLL
jgi:presenilin-like A22 family membrane protease